MGSRDALFREEWSHTLRPPTPTPLAAATTPPSTVLLQVHKEWKAKVAAQAAAEAAVAKPPDWAASYDFTGPLRPAAYGPRRTV